MADENAKSSPMTYESKIMENLELQRTVAATQADEMTVAELSRTAEDLMIDTGGAKSKKALVDAVKNAAMPSTTDKE